MADHAVSRLLTRARRMKSSALALHDGSRAAVIGGGPVGSFFSYFLLDIAQRIGISVHVDIYERRDFRLHGPAGCNMCGGVLYQSLVQSLAIEGINLPTSIVQRGIECNRLPPDFSSAPLACHCSPRINARGSRQPFGDRIVFVGDSGVSRLYKDGIGAAYRAAKVVASTAIFHGVSSRDFERYHLPFCRRMEFDNQVGRLLFSIIGLMQKTRLVRQAVLRLVSQEQQGQATPEQGMSGLI